MAIMMVGQLLPALVVVLFGTLLSFTGLVSSAGRDVEYDWPHSLYPPFVDSSGVNKHWDFDAFISTYSFVRLTPDEHNRSGWLFTNSKFDSMNWSIEFQFHIVASNPKNTGDGLAFWFTEEPYSPGTAFGNRATFKGLGVFFDTYANQRHSHKFPYISAMVGTGPGSVYDPTTDGDETSIGGCQAAIANTENPVRAKITYIKHTLEVLLEFNQAAGWTPCFKANNVHLPNSAYIGFTASTGDARARHDIVSVTASDIGKPGGFMDSKLFEHSEAAHSYLFFFLLAVGVIGFVIYYFRDNSRPKYSQL